MLGILKSLFSSPPKEQEPVVDAVFQGRFSERFRLGPIPLEGGAMVYGALGSAPWFNPGSKSDRKVLMGDHQAVLETDDPAVLAALRGAKYAPHHGTVLYQPWREPDPRGVRLLGAMTPEMATVAGEALRGGPVEHLYLVTGGILSGALLELRNALRGHRLKTLGVFWYFSGDDMTDDPRVVDDIVALAQSSGTERLSILTAAVDSVVEQRLARGLEESPLVRECSVFEKDDQARYARFRTPDLDKLMAER